LGDFILKGKRGGSAGKSLAGAVVALVPSSFTYDGAVKVQAVASVTLNGQTLTPGTDYAVMNNEAVEAGTHTLTVLGIMDYTGAAIVPWSIAKAQGSVSASPSTLDIQGEGATATAALAVTGDGALSAQSSDPAIVTASVSGSTVTVTVVGAGTATVIVTLAEGTNYLGATCQIAVTASLAHVYGVSWDGTSTTAWTRTDDAADFVDPVPYVAGASSYGSPFDNLMPWSGMVKVEDSEAGTMVAIPKFWYSLTQSGSGMKIQIADMEADGFSVSPAHMDRGDGKGERDVVYYARYHCASDYKSKTGYVPVAQRSRPTFRSGVHALGSTIWVADWAMRFTIMLLYLVEFANWNSQSMIGYGCGNNSAPQSMGYTDNMPYHTGTTQSSRTTYGLGTQYRYIEGLWDNVLDWLDGCVNTNTGLKLILNPSSFSDSDTGTLVGLPPMGNTYPSAFSVKDVSGTFPLFIPSAANGSDITYSCDRWDYDIIDVNMCPCAGGNRTQDLYRGLFYFGQGVPSYTSAGIGSRSMKLP
jgi:hypothetical protein